MGLPCQERGFLPPSALAKGAGGGFQRSFNGWGETGATIAFGDCPPPPPSRGRRAKTMEGEGLPATPTHRFPPNQKEGMGL